jgi:hypothetical protein
VLCDARTNYIYNWYIFQGTATSVSKPGPVILDKLMAGKGFEGAGHILFADNYFSSTNLARELWRRYGAYYVGTHKLTSKKSAIKTDDFQYKKLPNATLKYVPLGTVRQCFQKVDGVTSSTRNKFDGKFHPSPAGPPSQPSASQQPAHP